MAQRFQSGLLVRNSLIVSADVHTSWWAGSHLCNYGRSYTFVTLTTPGRNMLTRGRLAVCSMRTAGRDSGMLLAGLPSLGCALMPRLLWSRLASSCSQQYAVHSCILFSWYKARMHTPGRRHLVYGIRGVPIPLWSGLVMLLLWESLHAFQDQEVVQG